MSNDNNKKPDTTPTRFTGSATPAQLAAKGVNIPPPPPPTPPSVTDVLNQLAKYLSRPVVRGLYYNNKLINLDGYEFVECRFDNCALVAGSTNFDIINCVIDPSTTIQYGKETLKIIHLHNRSNEWLQSTGSHLAPKRNSDGTITITGITP